MLMRLRNSENPDIVDFNTLNTERYNFILVIDKYFRQRLSIFQKIVPQSFPETISQDFTNNKPFSKEILLSNKKQKTNLASKKFKLPNQQY